MSRKLDRIDAARQRRQQACGTIPCTEELAETVGIGVREAESLLRLQRQPLSINDADGDQKTLAELIADPRQECLDDHIDQDSLRRRLDDVLGDLDFRERQVLRMRFGLQGQLPLGLADIGKVLRVSKERIRQIEEIAMSKLRQPRVAARFVGFFADSPERLMSGVAVLRRSDECKEPCGRKRTAG